MVRVRPTLRDDIGVSGDNRKMSTARWLAAVQLEIVDAGRRIGHADREGQLRAEGGIVSVPVVGERDDAVCQRVLKQSWRSGGGRASEQVSTKNANSIALKAMMVAFMWHFLQWARRQSASISTGSRFGRRACRFEQVSNLWRRAQSAASPRISSDACGSRPCLSLSGQDTAPGRDSAMPGNEAPESAEATTERAPPALSFADPTRRAWSAYSSSSP